MSKRSFGLIGLMLVGMFVLASCADPAQPTATPNTSINPTPAGGQPTPTPGGGPTATPAATATPAPADPAAGQTLFAANCAACHNLTSETLVGPGLAGIATTAANRVSGQSAEDYLRISIKSPGEFLVEGYGPIMPPFSSLGEAGIEDLVAYLMTLQ